MGGRKCLLALLLLLLLTAATAISTEDVEDDVDVEGDGEDPWTAAGYPAPIPKAQKKKPIGLREEGDRSFIEKYGIMIAYCVILMGTRSACRLYPTVNHMHAARIILSVTTFNININI